MNKLKILVVASCLALSATAQADWSKHRDYRGDHRDGWARVISSVPQYEWVRVQRQVCTQERGHRGGHYQNGGRPYGYSDGHSVGAAVIGGIAGGVIGNQIGDGHVAATAIGAAVGAIVGDQIGSNGRYGAVVPAHYSRPVERCHTVYERQRRMTGYLVTYEYNGRRHTRVMDRDPGRRFYVDVVGRPGRGRY